MQKIVLFEFNEVPYKVIDHYCRLRQRSALANILARSEQFETVTEDQLALDPWISWPTMHRGVPDTKHQILHLGQVLDDVDAAYPPVWRILKQHRIPVGVFGSLHSSSVPDDAKDYSFYVADYFGTEVFANPESLMPFQELNLRMTRQSARNVSRSLPVGAALKFAATAPLNGVSVGTLSRVAGHLARETLSSKLKIRRRNLQPLVSFDLFMHQLASKKPRFSTFYTNHVAAAMHRYWGATFPEDFASGTLASDWIDKYRDELTAAMDTLDLMLAKLVRLVEAEPGWTLVLASSMGQAAIPASHTYEFLTITSLEKFMGAMGIPPGRWQSRPAMVPVQCVTVDPEFRERFINGLQGLRIGGDRMVEHARPTPPMSYDEREAGFFQLFIQYDHFDQGLPSKLNGQSVAREAIGLGMMAHEDGVNCTAQHVPGGSLLVYVAGSNPRGADGRRQVSTLDFVPSVLREFGVPQPEYMPGTASIRLS